jgi:hypothetical protein
VWTASGKFKIVPNRHFPLYGIQQGCRTVLIYSPRDVSCWWESNKHKDGLGSEAFQLGANVVAYATGLEPPVQKGTEMEVGRKEPGKVPPRGTLKIAQLKYVERDWQPAPKAVYNLMVSLRGLGLKNVALEPEPLSIDNDDLPDYKFLYMHGRNQFSFKAEELKALRFNLENGGMLLADACCGSTAFDKSFQKFMEELWKDSKADPKPKFEPIPPDDPLFGEKLNGTAIKTVRCRRKGAAGFQEVKPLLEGVKVNGRWVVIYSKYDIGCALEHSKTSNCIGHDFESARRLATAAVLYALKR